MRLEAQGLGRNSEIIRAGVPQCGGVVWQPLHPKQKQMGRIDFANSLRGIAAITVLFAHYVLMFKAMGGAYAGLPALGISIYPAWIPEVADATSINLGAFGVALFFLISGLVIPNSVASFSRTSAPRIGFIINRFFRLVPTYACGLLFAFFALWFAASQGGNPFVLTVSDYFWNISFFRDWTSVTPIGGVIWTLEVEAKFYLFILLFWSPLSRGKAWPVAVAVLAMLAAAPLKAQMPDVWAPPLNFVWFFKYVAFMCIGILYNFHHRGLISIEALFGAAPACLCAFVLAMQREQQPGFVTTSYVAAFALFNAMYLFARGWTGGRVVRFLADISYPLYAMHATFGYVGLWWLMHNGVRPLFALPLQTGLTVLIAWMIHRLIEVPTHRWGKALLKGSSATHGSHGVAST